MLKFKNKGGYKLNTWMCTCYYKEYFRSDMLRTPPHFQKTWKKNFLLLLTWKLGFCYENSPHFKCDCPSKLEPNFQYTIVSSYPQFPKANLCYRPFIYTPQVEQISKLHHTPWHTNKPSKSQNAIYFKVYLFWDFEPKLGK